MNFGKMFGGGLSSRLGYYRMAEDVPRPQFATSGSACFDICAYIPPYSTVKTYDLTGGEPYKMDFTIPSDGKLRVCWGFRYLVPTGLILDIPEGFSVRLHPRSSLSIKKGITFPHSEGIVDSDYVEQVFMPVTSAHDGVPPYIENGERICQAELVRNESYLLTEDETKPLPKSERLGGMGSTGKF